MQHSLLVAPIAEPLCHIPGKIPDTIGSSIPKKEADRTGLAQALLSGIRIPVAKGLSPGVGSLLHTAHDPAPLTIRDQARTVRSGIGIGFVPVHAHHRVIRNDQVCDLGVLCQISPGGLFGSVNSPWPHCVLEFWPHLGCCRRPVPRGIGAGLPPRAGRAQPGAEALVQSSNLEFVSCLLSASARRTDVVPVSMM